MQPAEETTTAAADNPFCQAAMPLPISSARWSAALMGLGLAVFAVVALSGPGRIDIIDAQTRFEVARSLVEHGDSILRDPRVTWSCFPGRNGDNYTYYRFPQSLLGVPAIWLADATGPVAEGRRHFFFVLTSAFAAAVLAVSYAVWFRHLGHAVGSACAWAAGGVLCTPAWFYGTSTFDDILGAALVVPALVLAFQTRNSWSRVGALLAGIVVGLAFNCKQPLGAFIVAAAAFHDRGDQRWQVRRINILLVAVGVAIGVGVEQAYDLWKFPLATRAAHAETLKQFIPIWPAHFLSHLFTALICFALSPATGVFWYCPPLLLCIYGMVDWWRREPKLVWGTLASVTVFVLFVASMMFFKGDPAWGPRYLTPIFSVLWLFAPAGAARMRPRLVRLLLALGVIVQLLALSLDQHRLYIEANLPSSYGSVEPWSYFVPAFSHLPNRPREILEVLSARGRAAEFAPSSSPTFAFPIIDSLYKNSTGPEAVQRYHILNSFRPWWASQCFLAPENRPVNLVATATLLLAMAISGLVLVLAACRRVDFRATII